MRAATNHDWLSRDLGNLFKLTLQALGRNEKLNKGPRDSTGYEGHFGILLLKGQLFYALPKKILTQRGVLCELIFQVNATVSWGCEDGTQKKKRKFLRTCEENEELWIFVVWTELPSVVNAPSLQNAQDESKNRQHFPCIFSFFLFENRCEMCRTRSPSLQA